MGERVRAFVDRPRARLDTIVPQSTKYEFSIKCHSFVHFEKIEAEAPRSSPSGSA
jgi:hypothetical protein